MFQFVKRQTRNTPRTVTSQLKPLSIKNVITVLPPERMIKYSAFKNAQSGKKTDVIRINEVAMYRTLSSTSLYALGKIGIDAAVASMGTALTSEHIKILRSLNVEIRLCLDGDLPGQKATMGIANDLAKAGLNVRIVDNQNSTKDPDEILNSDGAMALNAYLNKLVSRVDFILNYYMNTNPLQTTEQKTTLINEFIPVLLAIRSQLELDTYINKLANITGFAPDAIRNILKTARKKPAETNLFSANGRSRRPPGRPTATRALIRHSLRSRRTGRRSAPCGPARP